MSGAFFVRDPTLYRTSFASEASRKAQLDWLMAPTRGWPNPLQD